MKPSIIIALITAGTALAKLLLGFIRRKKINKESDESALLGAAEDVVSVIPVPPTQKDK